MTAQKTWVCLNTLVEKECCSEMLSFSFISGICETKKNMAPKKTMPAMISYGSLTLAASDSKY